MFACIYSPRSDGAPAPLTVVAEQFSPRYEQHGEDLVTIDLSGLQRLFGDPWTIGEELRRTARTHQLQVHVAIAGTRTTAMLLAQAHPGVTVIDDGGERAALAPLPISILERFETQPPSREARSGEPRRSSPTSPTSGGGSSQSSQKKTDQKNSVSSVSSVLKTWGLRTLGELAALPAADLSARLGQNALAWQAIARGEDARPLVPAVPDERFESALELEWPIEGLEPLSFVLTRLLEPLIVRLERRDRGAAAIVTSLRLVSRETCTRRLELPTPLRDVRALRTLVLLDLDSHPPGGGIDAVTVTIEPTPGRILQHTLFTRPTPTPEQLSTLVARLHALMGQDRVGTPAVVDSYRPGAFAMNPFAVEHDDQRSRLRAGDASASLAGARHDSHRAEAGTRGTRRKEEIDSASSALTVVAGSLRRCRQPVAARVAVEDGRPVRVTADRRGFAGGPIVRAAGPWRVSGEWWEPSAYRRDEWDVTLADGTVYRVFRDDFSERWFIDAVYD